MSKNARPRRSVLYMPGSNKRALEKGRTLAADGLILDLEDAVAPDAKEKARGQIRDAIKEGGYGKRELIVRVNAMDASWGHDDLVAAATMGADAVLLPKVESASTVHQAEAILETSGAPEDLAVWCMMETPLGMLHAEEISEASPRVGALVMGTSDLAKDLQCADTRDRLPFITSLGLCLLAARAAGIAILDGVHLDLNDDEGLEHSCRQGAELGFDGKTLIHPKTIDAANRAFAPSPEEVEWSKKIIAAHAEAVEEGQGIVVVDGKLIENLHVLNAERLVAMAQAIEEMENA
ncbi:MAG: CoA ester lyase [Rhodospirillaceae bacterium]|jgi:citrate lyase subunit beta/citryl-CoA lyase|nr:CoA ester lyase [Rhodospirillaceae bacterium]|tara:strand:+ start:8926 stop:9804 length:879 start_codon:yes stop_codon:yes gene_type:complete